jgi:hypothetical protein
MYSGLKWLGNVIPFIFWSGIEPVSFPQLEKVMIQETFRFNLEKKLDADLPLCPPTGGSLATNRPDWAFSM